MCIFIYYISPKYAQGIQQWINNNWRSKLLFSENKLTTTLVFTTTLLTNHAQNIFKFYLVGCPHFFKQTATSSNPKGVKGACLPHSARINTQMPIKSQSGTWFQNYLTSSRSTSWTTKMLKLFFRIFLHICMYLLCKHIYKTYSNSLATKLKIFLLLPWSHLLDSLMGHIGYYITTTSLKKRWRENTKTYGFPVQNSTRALWRAEDHQKLWWLWVCFTAKSHKLVNHVECAHSIHWTSRVGWRLEFPA